MLWFYVAAAKGEERAFLNSAVAVEYQRYMRTTGMFVPLVPMLGIGFHSPAVRKAYSHERDR
jgi:hypothetical protein